MTIKTKTYRITCTCGRKFWGTAEQAKHFAAAHNNACNGEWKAKAARK